MSEQTTQLKATHKLVTLDEVQGYAAMQKEELGQTLALLDLTTQQIEKCNGADEVEALFDEAIANNGQPLEDHVIRRICRSITLVGLMSQTPIPAKYYLMDELVYKAVVELMLHQKALQEEAAKAGTETQATEVTH